MSGELITLQELLEEIRASLKVPLDHSTRGRVAALLSLVAKEVRPCKRCGRVLYFVAMAKSGKLNPYTDDATSHFVDCPHAASFRRDATKQRQTSLPLPSQAPAPRDNDR